MNRQAPLLSVVIATRNRVKYAISAIESILTFTTDCRLELVVQDNTESQELAHYVSQHIRDNRLRYHHSPETLASIENFDRAVALSTGEYLCIIGDDDGINPEIMDATSWAKDNNVDVITVMRSPFFLWPGSHCPSGWFTKVEAGLLRIADPIAGAFRPFDAATHVRKYLHTLVYDGETHLIRLYHGIVRRSCLEQVFERTGRYLKGLSPDIYSAIALSEFVKNAFVTEYPLTISGACNASTTIDAMTGKHEGALDQAIHLRGLKGYGWDVLVPRFYSPETIWADSALAALRNIGRVDLLATFNVPRLAALCFACYRQSRPTIIGDMFRGSNSLHKNTALTTLLFLFYILRDPTAHLAWRISNRLRLFYKGEGVARVSGLRDMSEVTKTLIEHLSRKGVRIGQFLK